MKIKTQKITASIKALNTIQYVALMVFLSFIVILPLLLIYMAMHGTLDSEKILTANPPLRTTVVALSIGPAFETFFCQFIPITIITKNLSLMKRKYISIIISALVFSALHFSQDIDYFFIFKTFLIGIVLAGCYINCGVTKRHPFLVTAAVHIIHNAILFIANSIIFFYAIKAQ